VEEEEGGSVKKKRKPLRKREIRRLGKTPYCGLINKEGEGGPEADYCLEVAQTTTKEK